MPDLPLAAGIIHRGNRPLTSIDQWPRKDCHWKDGHSAKENARAWLDAAPGLQPDIARILAACRDIGPVRRWCAEPEARIRIDSFRGEPPNIDLLIVAEDDHGPVVIAIEAKVNEPFGKELTLQYQCAQAAKRRSKDSKAVDRIEHLLARFGLDIEQPHVRRLRYQLLTATAAALKEAERRSSQRAMLIVHEFVTSRTCPEESERNVADLNHFLATALDRRDNLAAGDVAGPFRLQGAPALYVGKTRTAVSSS